MNPVWLDCKMSSKMFTYIYSVTDCVNHGSSYCCVVDQLLNIKHISTALVHTQSVTLYIYNVKTFKLILQSSHTGLCN